MVADANIFAQFLRPPTSAAEYADKFAASEAAQQQNALNRLAMGEKMRAMEDQNRLRQLYQQNPSITSDQLKQAGFRDEALKMDSAALERRKTETEIGYKAAQTSKEQVEAQAKAADSAYQKLTRHRQEAYSVRSPQEAVSWIDRAIADGVPGFSQDMREQAIAKLSEFRDLNEWKAAVNDAAIPAIERYKQAAEDARAALKMAMPDYTVLDSSTGVVRVDKKTGLAQPVTYAPTAPAPVSPSVPNPVPATPRIQAPAPAQSGSDRYISPETQRARDTDRLAILIQELQKATNPEDRAALEREIRRAGGTPAAANAITSPAAPTAPVQVQKPQTLTQPFEVTGQDGKPVLVRQDAKGNITPVEGYTPRTPPAKDIPASVTQKIIENKQSMSNIDSAIAAVQANPGAFGVMNAIPGVERIRQGDQKGVDARAQVANIGSLVLHDRSGVSVSASEFPRLAPFIPSSSDSAAAIVTKLKKMKAIAESELGLYAQAYGPENGYKPSTPTNHAPASSNGWTVTEVK